MTSSYYKDKNILVIGASFGIGEDLCRQLSDLGANLAISARSESKITNLAKNLGSNHFSVVCDIAKKEDTLNLANKINDCWQQIDLIIFCVGIYQPMTLDNFDMQKSEEIININFNGFLNILDAFLPKIKDKKISHLAIISSIAGYFGMPRSIAYGASKAALSNLAESLYYELRKYSVKVQLINPGFVKTRLTDKNSFEMPGIISSSKAAKIIIKNLPKKKFEILFPFGFGYFMKFLSKLPYALRLFLLKYVK